MSSSELPRGSVHHAQAQSMRIDRAYAADPLSDEAGLIREFGVVVEVTDGGVWVQTQRQSGCQSCSSQGSCGVGVLSKALNRRHHRVWAATDIPLAAGDQVQLVLPASALVQASLLMYLLPLVGLIGGAIVAQQLFSAVGASVLGAALGFGLPLFGLYRLPVWLARRGHFAPRVERVDWRLP